jgi:hypothetical protein
MQSKYRNDIKCESIILDQICDKDQHMVDNSIERNKKRLFHHVAIIVPTTINEKF